MGDFKFIQFPSLDKWVISAPRRAKRYPRKDKRCVFCPGNESELEQETYRIPTRDTLHREVGGANNDSHWKIRVIENKYPFAPIHDIVVLTPDHVKKTSEIPLELTRLGFEAYVNRYNAYKDKGSVVIFGNSQRDAGESIGHPHAQIAVVPDNVDLEIPKLEKNIDYWGEHMRIGEFEMVCPPYAQWPDEVWVVPLDRGKTFGEITFSEIESLAYVWSRLIKIFELRHAHNFPHNFYIYPFKDWYIRLIPREKSIGGFEISTGIFVNTQDPRETMDFIKKHFVGAEEHIIRKHRAKYRKGV